MNDGVLVTGATGFIGSAIVRALVGEGRTVVALVQPGVDESGLDGLPVERRVADLRDPQEVRAAVEGCRTVFHVAALYRFWAPDPKTFYAVNVDGTRNVLAAARDTDVERVVYTSTVGTLGLDAGRPAQERDYPDVGHLFGSYKRSKYVAEHEVLRAAAEGQPICLVQPTTPIGPGDRAPTPTGRIVLDFLNGRMPGFVDTELNVVHVDDVARGHLHAADKGTQGRSYIVGGENLSLAGVLRELAELTGLPVPRLRVPHALAFAAAHVSELVEGRLLRKPPHVPLEAVRMSTTRMAFDDTRARTELGYTSRSARDALADSARWYLDNGRVKPARAARISASVPRNR
ncbi:MAG: dihydroflavonol-4-reductase [Pseudonocardiales bacterium]|nr:dihydroflavonol-4-reductase [Pseudonocardiales bacterium]